MAPTMDSILKLSTPKKVLILGITLCVIVGLYLWAFLIPLEEEIKAARAERSKVTKELNESKAVARDLQKYKEQVAKLNEELRDALTQLPNETEIPEILKTLSSLGKEASLEFTLIRPKAEQAQQFIANVPIELNALGNYHNVGMFFDKVSKLPRIINVVDFNLARAKDVKGKLDNETLLKTSCIISTYRFIEKKGEEKKSEKKASPTGTEGQGIPKAGKK